MSNEPIKRPLSTFFTPPNQKTRINSKTPQDIVPVEPEQNNSLIVSNLPSASSDDSSNAVLSSSRSIELEDEEDESIVYRKVTDKTSNLESFFGSHQLREQSKNILPNRRL